MLHDANFILDTHSEASMDHLSSPDLVLKALLNDPDEIEPDDLPALDTSTAAIQASSALSRDECQHDSTVPVTEALEMTDKRHSVVCGRQPSPVTASETTTIAMAEESPHSQRDPVAPVASDNSSATEKHISCTAKEVSCPVLSPQSPGPSPQEGPQSPQDHSQPSSHTIDMHSDSSTKVAQLDRSQSTSSSSSNHTFAVPALPRRPSSASQSRLSTGSPILPAQIRSLNGHGQSATTSNGFQVPQDPVPGATPQITVQAAGTSADGQLQYVATVNGVPVVVYSTPQGWTAAPIIPPIGPPEEHLLINALSSSRRQERSDKEAIEQLHGVNQHTAAQWTEYYLQHSVRINKIIESEHRRRSLSADAASSSSSRKDKRKEVSRKNLSIKSERDRSPSLSTDGTYKRHPQAFTTKPLHNRSSPRLPRHKGISAHSQRSRRSRSRSADDSDSEASSPAPQPRKLPTSKHNPKLPRVPQRSPTPPTRVVPRGIGNEYTAEDDAYFRDLLLYELARNPNITRKQLTDMLAEKCPHHTQRSWNEYWRKHPETVEPIMLDALKRRNANGTDRMHGQTRYEDQSDEDSGSAYDPHEDRGKGSEDDKASVRRTLGWRPRRTSSPVRDSLVEDDVHRIAERIVADPDWDTLDTRRKWHAFEELWPHRSWEAWYRFARNNDEGEFTPCGTSLFLMTRLLRCSNQSSGTEVQARGAAARAHRRACLPEAVWLWFVVEAGAGWRVREREEENACVRLILVESPCLLLC
ncbi:hypothetical protein CERSUDRAFT_114732, partial [Gelatoporia subvermispora B]